MHVLPEHAHGRRCHTASSVDEPDTRPGLRTDLTIDLQTPHLLDALDHSGGVRAVLTVAGDKLPVVAAVVRPRVIEEGLDQGDAHAGGAVAHLRAGNGERPQ